MSDARRSGYLAPHRIRNGRECDPVTLLRQIGGMNVRAISGGRWDTINTCEGIPIGVVLPSSTNRVVEITLGGSDTYTVRRYRQIVRGERRGEDILEYEMNDVYCEQIGEIAFRASCFQ